MSTKGFSFSAERSHSLYDVFLILAILFGPLVFISLFWRSLSPSLARWIGTLAIIWMLLAWLPLGIYWKRSIRPQRKALVRFVAGKLVFDHWQTTREFDLQRGHALFILLKHQADREAGFQQRWAEIFLSQNGQRLILKVFLSSGDFKPGNNPPIKAGSFSALGCVVEGKKLSPLDRFLMFFETCTGIWVADNIVSVSFLEDLDRHASSNRLLPAVQVYKSDKWFMVHLLREWHV